MMSGFTRLLRVTQVIKQHNSRILTNLQCQTRTTSVCLENINYKLFHQPVRFQSQLTVICSKRHPLNRLTPVNACLYSTDLQPKPQPDKDDQQEVQKPASIGLYQRFKNAYKEYGKVLIGVHCATSVVWFGSFYYAAVSGIDVIPLLEKLGAGETILKPFKSTGVGDIAVAYLLYKLATPARYTVTIGGTQYTVKALRKMGYMDIVPQGDSIRELMKEGRQQVRDKVDDKKVDMKEKWDDRKVDMKEKWDDRKVDMKEKWGERKDKMKDKADTLKDKWDDRKNKPGEKKS